MNIYHFNAAGSDKQLGYTSEVYAESREHAAQVLADYIDGNGEELRTFDKCREHDDDAAHVHFLNVWNNGRPVTASDIDEARDSDDNEICQYCARSTEQLHEGGCPDALAQDLDSGEIGPGDDSYGDALEAYELIYGHPFHEPGEVTNAQRAEWAQSAINAFRDATRADEEDALADLLCDLLHLYGDERFDNDLRRGRGHYAVELTEDPAE